MLHKNRIKDFYSFFRFSYYRTGWFVILCVVLPVKRASINIGAICSVVIGGVFADCILNNNCSPTKIYGAVAGGHICWFGGRAENVLDFQLQNT